MNFLPKILKYALGTSHLLVDDRMSLYVPLHSQRQYLRRIQLNVIIV